MSCRAFTSDVWWVLNNQGRTAVTTKVFRWQDNNNMRLFLVFLPSMPTQENSGFLAQSSPPPPLRLPGHSNYFRLCKTDKEILWITRLGLVWVVWRSAKIIQLTTSTLGKNKQGKIVSKETWLWSMLSISHNI